MSPDPEVTLKLHHMVGTPEGAYRQIVCVDYGKGWDSKKPKGRRPAPWWKAFRKTDSSTAYSLLGILGTIQTCASIPPIQNQHKFKKELLVKFEGNAIQTWAVKHVGKSPKTRLYGFFCGTAENHYFVIALCERHKASNKLEKAQRKALEAATKRAWSDMASLVKGLTHEDNR